MFDVFQLIFMLDSMLESARTSTACFLDQSLCPPLRKNGHGMYLRNWILFLCRQHARFLWVIMILVPSGHLVVRSHKCHGFPFFSLTNPFWTNPRLLAHSSQLPLAL
uniref:Uncharacterized protein MANES_07G024000 n=1 Tax=Rhizophora mucronata TaxID=61149 RepID=A0A2P2KZF2_RHIMU